MQEEYIPGTQQARQRSWAFSHLKSAQAGPIRLWRREACRLRGDV